MIKSRHVLAIALVLVGASSAYAGDLTKEECVDAHSKGQDAKEAGKLSLARKLFLTCAQTSCPSVVQGDCARFADDLTRIQPSLTFAARDGSGSDMPDTTVYVDDQLLVTRLDGQPHDVDPGTHTVKFSSNGKEQTVTVVVGSGEKGRLVVGTFASINPPSSGKGGGTSIAAVHASEPRTSHAGGARVVMGAGVALVATGAVLTVFGFRKIPANCTFSSHECAAPPGDPSLQTAADGVRMADYGMLAGGVGVAALAGGIIWYMKSAHTETPKEGVVATPWVGNGTSGFAISGHF